MDEQVLRYREAKLMEPIYRMYKVIEQTDTVKAQTLMSVAMQYIIEHFRGKNLQPKDVQQILRVLLQEESGHYYALYVNNEIQVKAAEWLTLLAVDRPVTLELLGKMADALAQKIEGRDCIKLSAEDVFIMLEQIVAPVDEIVLERLYLNKENYLAELRTFLVQ